jgi:hypothetical protein
MMTTKDVLYVDGNGDTEAVRRLCSILGSREDIWGILSCYIRRMLQLLASLVTSTSGILGGHIALGVQLFITASEYCICK